MAYCSISLAAIPILLVARFIAVGLPALVSWSSQVMAIRNVPFLAWAGIRGGISVALALSAPDSAARSAILAPNYAVVLFSIILQGSTLGYVADRAADA